jgi:hypothetical protein
MSETAFIDGLVATAEPVRRRRVSRELVAIAAVAALHLLGMTYYFSGELLADALARDMPRMVLKIGLFGLASIVFTALAVRSLHPAARRVGPLMAAAGGLFVAAALIGFDYSLAGGIEGALLPQYGVFCALNVLSLSLPVTLVLAFVAMRGASTRPDRTAWLVGLAGGSWGAFVYALQCPFVGVYYLCVWYGGGVLLTALIVRLLLPRLTRW